MDWWLVEIHFWALLAILPGTTLYVFLGATAGSLSDSEMGGEDPTITIIVVVVGIVFGFGAVFMTSYYAKQELNKVAEQRRVELEGMEGAEKDEEAGAKEYTNSILCIWPSQVLHTASGKGSDSINVT